MNRRTLMLTAGATIALGGGAAALLARRSGSSAFGHCPGGSVAGGDIGGAFDLVRHDGVTVTETDVIDRLSLVYFGYTFCPDVCPLDVARNADAVDRLADLGHPVRPIFISLDPERDTPDVMADFVGYMHEDMIGLTGTSDQVNVAKRAYKAYGDKMPGGGEDYLVAHSTLSYLMHPDHGMMAFFRNDQTAADMAAGISCFAEAL